MVSTIFIPRAAFHPKQNVSFEIGNLFGIKGIVAVITGVYIVGRRKESLEKAAAEAGNGSIIAVQGDVKSKESLEAVAEGMKKEQGSINVLFANSGVIGFKEAVWGPSVEEFTHAYHVNVSGVFYTALPFLELLDEGNKQGDVEQKFNIIVTTSIAGFSRKLSAGFAYSTSKARTTHLVKMLAT
ncbi:short chain dehydrogenase/reductase family [Diplocarpon mali]|nr:short chain dehydrogenase/reductase family [Diplocarpon mali]